MDPKSYTICFENFTFEKQSIEILCNFKVFFSYGLKMCLLKFDSHYFRIQAKVLHGFISSK
jgi:hypothetical protein